MSGVFCKIQWMISDLKSWDTGILTTGVKRWTEHWDYLDYVRTRRSYHLHDTNLIQDTTTSCSVYKFTLTKSPLILWNCTVTLYFELKCSKKITVFSKFISIVKIRIVFLIQKEISGDVRNEDFKLK